MPSPLFSVCEFTTPDTSFSEDLSLYAQEGAEGIGIVEGKLVDTDPAEAMAQFEASGLKAASGIGLHVSPLPSDPWFPGPAELDDRVENMCASVRRLATFGPATVIVLTGSGRGRPEATARSVAVEALREVARFARTLGVTLSVEPIRTAFGMDLSIVSTFDQGLRLIEEIGANNLKLMYDVHHLWDSPDILALTRRYARCVGGVQVSDWRTPTRGYEDRLLPGDGVIDLPAMFEALREGGFSGWYDLEVFSDDGRGGLDFPDSLWRLSPAELVRRGRSGFLRCWSSAEERTRPRRG